MSLKMDVLLSEWLPKLVSRRTNRIDTYVDIKEICRHKRNKAL